MQFSIKYRILIFYFVLSFCYLSCSANSNQKSELKVFDEFSKYIPTETGVFDFGYHSVNKTIVKTFTITNTGDSDVLLTCSPLVNICGHDSNSFSILQQPNSLISKESSTTFKIQFNPLLKKKFTCFVEIQNNCTPNNQYKFLIIGKSLKGFDFNGDGYDDVAIGAIEDDDGGDRSGCAFIFFGKSSPDSKLDASKADIKIVGEEYGNSFGYCVSNAGDVNGDGFDDVIISSEKNNKGVYIFFGKANTQQIINASTADVRIVGENIGDRFGHSVSYAGDVNKDGFDDFIVGAYSADDNGSSSGCAYIFFGRSNLPPQLNAANANIKLVGSYASAWFGHSVSYAGDVNNDGFDDVIVGAYRGSSTGGAFIFLGSYVSPSIIYSADADCKIIGNWIECVGNAGDVNGDGIEDFLVGPNIFYGRAFLPISIDISNASVNLTEEYLGDDFGNSVSFAGDVNNDGFGDILISAKKSGSAFIFLGGNNLPSSISALNADIKIIGSNLGGFGYCVSNAGDVNGDNNYDFLVSAYQDDEGGIASGCVYILFGSVSHPAKIDATKADVKLIGEDAGDIFGYSVSGGR